MATPRTAAKLGAIAAAAVAAGSLFLHGSEAATPRPSVATAATSARALLTAQPATADSALAARFLAGLRGAKPLACEMAIRSLGIGWGWRGRQHVPDAQAEQEELLRWASSRPKQAGVVPPLTAGLEDGDPCVRRMAARLLGRMRTPAATRALLEALSAPDPRTRQLGAIGLGYAEDPATVDSLLQALRDDAAGVRATAAWALGEIEDPRALPALTRLLARDPDPDVRRAAAIAIGDLY